MLVDCGALNYTFQMQGNWGWLTVGQLLSDGEIDDELRQALAQLDARQKLSEVVNRLDGLRQTTTFQDKAIEMGSMGLLMLTPLAIMNPVLRLLTGAVLWPYLWKIRQEDQTLLRLARSGFAARIRRAGDAVGPPWRISDGEGCWDRRYDSSPALPLRETYRDARGEARSHRFELIVPQGRLCFEWEGGNLQVRGPTGDVRRMLCSSVVHLSNMVVLSLAEKDLRVHLSGRLELHRGEAPDTICPWNMPGYDETIRLPDGERENRSGDSHSKCQPDQVFEDCFTYGSERLESPLPLHWLE